MRFQSVKEGLSTILLPLNGEVFYNPVQEFNRDLSVLVIAKYEQLLNEKRNNPKKIKILDALTASGFRAVRYAQQIPNVSKIFANDLDSNVIPTIQANIEQNSIPSNLIEISISDANALMHSMSKDEREKFDVIDLDPYGTAVPFLDAAIQSIADDGLLCVTCTDMAVLCGVHPDTCFSKYGSIPSHSPYCHEFAVRILLSTLEATASRYQRYIEPLVSAKIDFYTRVFVRVRKSPSLAKISATRKSLVFSCTSCRSFALHPLGLFGMKHSTGKFSLTHLTQSSKCEHCDSNIQICGPIWNGSLVNREFISRMLISLDANELVLGTVSRLKGFLTMLHEELDVSLYMPVNYMAKVLKCNMPSLETFKSALLNAGYAVSISHCDPLGIKSNAPLRFLWDIMRHWVTINPIKEAHKTVRPIHNILSKPIERTISLEVNEQLKNIVKSGNLVRFQVNPPNWGPKPRAKKHAECE